MSNPDMLRNLIVNNPQMQSMLDSNPQIRHVLNDPAVRLTHTNTYLVYGRFNNFTFCTAIYRL
jgi:hypothetical protein